VIRAHHEPRRCVQRRPDVYSNDLSWSEQRLLSDDARTVDVLGPAARVGDLPRTPQQAHRVGALVFDPHAIRPDKAIVVRTRLISEKKRAHGNRHAPRGSGRNLPASGLSRPAQRGPLLGPFADIEPSRSRGYEQINAQARPFVQDGMLMATENTPRVPPDETRPMRNGTNRFIIIPHFGHLIGWFHSIQSDIEQQPSVHPEPSVGTEEIQPVPARIPRFNALPSIVSEDSTIRRKCPTAA